VENYELEVEEAKQYDEMMQEKQRDRMSPPATISQNISGRHSTDSAISQPSSTTALNDRRRLHTLAEKRSFLVRVILPL
jgi:hypothetical protein